MDEQNLVAQPTNQGTDKFRRYGIPLLAVLETVLSKGQSPGTVAFTAEKGFQENERLKREAERQAAEDEDKKMQSALQRQISEGTIQEQINKSLSEEEQKQKEYAIRKALEGGAPVLEAIKTNDPKTYIEHMLQREILSQKGEQAEGLLADRLAQALSIEKMRAAQDKTESGITPYQAAQIALKEEALNLQKARNQSLTKQADPTEQADRAALVVQKALSLPKMKGFRSAVGTKGLSSLIGFKKQPFRGSPAADFNAELKNLQSMLTLNNLGSMRGLGAMSENEMKMIEASASSLSPDMSEKQFAQEIQKIVDKIQAARSVAGINKLTGQSDILKDTQPDTGNKDDQTVVKISTDAEYDTLPSGTLFVGPDGIPRTKP